LTTTFTSRSRLPLSCSNPREKQAILVEMPAPPGVRGLRASHRVRPLVRGVQRLCPGAITVHQVVSSCLAQRFHSARGRHFVGASHHIVHMFIAASCQLRAGSASQTARLISVEICATLRSFIEY
jgi:hypothetical protein